MEPVLMNNALEAWAVAIRLCGDIKDGKATLQYQKNFVSSLHNAVELIMKQMMLNNSDHRVAEVRKPKNEADKKLQSKYLKEKDLNNFFKDRSSDELLKFWTINFDKLISLHTELFGQSLEQGESLEDELKLLQKLRNSETHFMIRQGDFLSEKDFCTLHNFMIRFYKIMETWRPTIREDIELYILPYWSIPDGADNIYEFIQEPLNDFTYERAVKNSSLARQIAEILKGEQLYGAPDFSPYSIAKELVEEHTNISAQFDEIWAMVYMMQCLKMIVIDEILDDEQNEVHFVMNVLFE